MITRARIAEIERNHKGATDQELDELANILQWGSYGINGDEGKKVRMICSLDTDHIANILVDQHHIGVLYRKVLLHVYTKRLTSLEVHAVAIDQNTQK
jgi:hypothetical protein